MFGLFGNSALKARVEELERENKALNRDYMNVRAIYASLQAEHQSLVVRWNSLVDKVNAQGGLATMAVGHPQFTQEEIRRLIMLCHPDKHDGKQSAVEITQKLLRLRGN
jgi:predicted RNA polymerase sigma factor